MCMSPDGKTRSRNAGSAGRSPAGSVAHTTFTNGRNSGRGCRFTTMCNIIVPTATKGADPGNNTTHLHGPDDLPGFLERTFGAVVLESKPDGRDDPTNHFKTEGFFRSSIWNSRAVWPFPG